MTQDTEGQDRRRARDSLCKQLRALHEAKASCVRDLCNVSAAIREIDGRILALDEKSLWELATAYQEPAQIADPRTLQRKSA